MKKKIAIIILLTALLTVNVFGQADVGLLNTIRYAETFGFQRGVIDPASEYVVSAPRAERRNFANLNGNEVQIDAPLEFALLSYYSQPVINIRPVQANAILPRNNPKTADLKLGAAVFQEIQVLRFLASNAPTDASRTSASNAVGRHEGILKFITDRRNVTRAEVEAFYRNGIRTLISATVDEEFNKINFLIENRSSTHTAVLTRNPQNGHYTLSYGGTYTNNETRVITANSLEALSHEMRNGRYKNDFDQTGINAVRTQAALIPAVRLTDRALNEIKNILTNFYTTPNANTFNVIREVISLYTAVGLRATLERNSDGIFGSIELAYFHTLSSLNVELRQRVTQEAARTSDITALSAEQQRVLVQLR